ncbi:DUF3006 domain-containing protein [Salirhabdus salicampi]|uniref:DUF3006 domain-containing protein n=1 Tax=Salirhabdus salicampi TaxID=476102 RepID=UPI0020C23059|nr:DUF3006 domain-containing protein [Salirhabdus salicampi]MCP8615934.1 DUF3006 domain-containing protein [Salirhabdus salicampi]
MKKAVVDRIVDGKHAVLLVGQKEKEIIIDAVRLPEKAIEGTWVTIKQKGEDVEVISINDNETVETKQRIENKMDLLRQKKGSRFKT